MRHISSESIVAATVALMLTSGCGLGGGGGDGASSGDGSGPRPDLYVGSVDFSPASVVAGTPISVSNLVANSGPGAASNVRVAVYLSSDDFVTTADVLLGYRTVGNMAAGSSSSGGGSLVVPPSIGSGMYRIGAIADDLGAIAEGDEDDNVMLAPGSIAISIAPLPDLVATSVAFDSGTVLAGGVVGVTFGAQNQGTAAASTFQIGVYVSTDAVITTSDRLIGFRDVALLGPSAESPGTDLLTIPATLAAGAYNVGALVDHGGAVSETVETNNTSVALGTLLVLSAPAPDLVALDVVFDPPSADSGTVIQVGETVVNSGLASAATFQIGIYLSSDATITTQDYLLGTRTVAALGVGESSTETGPVTLPVDIAAGAWRVGVLVDRLANVSEASETNNTLAASASLAVTVPPRPDLAPEALSFSPSQINADRAEVLHVNEFVRNSGVLAAGSFRIGIYLSTNNVITTSDVLIGTRAVFALGIGDGSGASSDLVLPLGLSAGSYHVGVLADDLAAFLEMSEGNNALASLGTLDVVATPAPMADLFVQSASFGPATVQPGEAIQVQNTVRNQGNLSSGPFLVGIYLSTDDVISVDDLRIGERWIANLGIDFGSGSSAPYTVPASVTPGDYRVGVIADHANTVAESLETNNTLRANGILHVFVPPPPAPDLVVDAVTFTPTSATPPATLSVNLTVRNQGTLAAGVFRVALYASSDAAITTADVLIGFQALGGLGATQSFEGAIAVPLPASLATGTWRIGAFADDALVVLEGSESNNTLVATASLVIP